MLILALLFVLSVLCSIVITSLGEYRAGTRDSQKVRGQLV